MADVNENAVNLNQDVFMPRVANAKNERYVLKLSPEDWAKIERGRPRTARVTDLTTGRVYEARGAACGLPSCLCDAVAEPVSDEPEVPTFYRTWATGYSWFYKAEFEAVQTPADLAAILIEIGADIDEAQTLCTTPGITLDDVTFDKRDGYLFHFSTTDAALAEKLGFEVLA